MNKCCCCSTVFTELPWHRKHSCSYCNKLNDFNILILGGSISHKNWQASIQSFSQSAVLIDSPHSKIPLLHFISCSCISPCCDGVKRGSTSVPASALFWDLKSQACQRGFWWRHFHQVRLELAGSEGSGVLMRDTNYKKKKIFKKLQISCLFQFKVALKTAALHRKTLM